MKLILVLILSSAMISSCEIIPDPLYSNSVLSGYAYLGESYNTDTIMVIARGPYGKKVTYTGESAKYLFEGLGNGTYSLEFIKKGYSKLKQYGIQIFGNDTVYAAPVRLFRSYSDYMIPEFVKVSTGPQPRSNIYNCLILATHQKTGYFPLVFFMSTDEKLDYKNFKYWVRYYTVYGPFEKTKEDVIYINLNSYSFKSGEKVYIIGYVCNPNEYSSGYFDRYLGPYMISTFEPDKHTPVMSFVMP